MQLCTSAAFELARMQSSTTLQHTSCADVACQTQSGSAALKCLAFDESVGPNGHARSRRCQGRYSDAALDAALRPTEALALRVADQMAGQRRLDRASVPFA